MLLLGISVLAGLMIWQLIAIEHQLKDMGGQLVPRSDPALEDILREVIREVIAIRSHLERYAGGGYSSSDLDTISNQLEAIEAALDSVGKNVKEGFEDIAIPLSEIQDNTSPTA